MSALEDELRAEWEADLRAQFELWQERLGLGHWEITQHWGVAPPEHNGEAFLALCQASLYYERADVYFAPDWWEEDPDGGWERVIVHELLHCILRDLQQEFQATTRHLGKQLSDYARWSWYKHEERTVDALTAALLANWGSEPATS